MAFTKSAPKIQKVFQYTIFLGKKVGIYLLNMKVFCTFAQNTATKEEKEKEKTARESLGKFFYDLAKMTFGVMFLGNAATVFGFNEFTISSVVVLIFGSFMTWGFAYMGNKILKK